MPVNSLNTIYLGVTNLLLGGYGLLVIILILRE